MTTNWKKWVALYSVLLVFCVFLPALAMASANVGNAIDDSVITGKIKANLAMDQVTHATQITVTTNDGYVKLAGTVESETEATQAIEIASSSVGVKDVDASQLYVQDSTHPFADAYLTAKVKGTFLKNNLTAGKLNVPLVDVKVETQNGVVYLSGDVKNDRQRQRLISLAQSVNGVKEVKSTVRVQ